MTKIKTMTMLALVLSGCTDKVHKIGGESNAVYFNCNIQLMPHHYNPERASVYSVIVTGKGFYRLTANMSGTTLLDEIGENGVSGLIMPTDDFACVNIETLKGARPKIVIEEHVR